MPGAGRLSAFHLEETRHFSPLTQKNMVLRKLVFSTASSQRKKNREEEGPPAPHKALTASPPTPRGCSSRERIAQGPPAGAPAKRENSSSKRKDKTSAWTKPQLLPIPFPASSSLCSAQECTVAASRRRRVPLHAEQVLHHRATYPVSTSYFSVWRLWVIQLHQVHTARTEQRK